MSKRVQEFTYTLASINGKGGTPPPLCGTLTFRESLGTFLAEMLWHKYREYRGYNQKMDWKNEAIEMLSNYNAKRQSLTIIPLQIAEAETEMTSLRSCTNVLGVRVGKPMASDDKILNCIVKKEALQRCFEQSKLYVAAVEKGLEVLTEEERHILTVMYINREKGWKDRLMDELLLVEESSLYKKSRKILRQFTIAMYGCLEC